MKAGDITSTNAQEVILQKSRRGKFQLPSMFSSRPKLEGTKGEPLSPKTLLSFGILAPEKYANPDRDMDKNPPRVSKEYFINKHNHVFEDFDESHPGILEILKNPKTPESIEPVSLMGKYGLKNSYMVLVLGSIVLLLITLGVIVPADQKPTIITNPIVCTVILLMFFKLCFMAEQALGNEKAYGVDGMFGIFSLMVLSISLLTMNALTSIGAVKVATAKRFRKFKPNGFGCLLVLGAGAIVFGFLDNYGMKLGTDALEDGLFWKLGLNALGTNTNDTQCFDYKDGLNAFNKFFTPSNPAIQKLFIDGTGGECSVPRMREIVERYVAIKNSGAMLGNTFSDFVGALLGAGIGGLFSYLTSINNDVSDPDLFMKILQNPVSKVVLEACFIAMGCLIPVGLHFRGAAKELNQSKEKKPAGCGKWLYIGNTTFIALMALIILGLVVAQGWVKYDESVVDADEDYGDPNDHSDLAISMTGVGLMVLLMVFLYRSFKKAGDEVDEMTQTLIGCTRGPNGCGGLDSVLYTPSDIGTVSSTTR